MEPELVVDHLSFHYKAKPDALREIQFSVPKNSVTALIGPSGCGKTTLLRCFNRMHDLYKENRYEGKIFFRNKDILDPSVDLIDLRTQIGMVFQTPTPFPMSIFDNVAYGIRLHTRLGKAQLIERVERALQDAALWDEVKDKLHSRATTLSGGQQQRLVIARALAVNPEILLFDEPTSALDPASTDRIEKLIVELKKKMTVIIVTHNMQQAGRIADFAAFLWLGRLIEFGSAVKIFESPEHKKTQDYIKGRFG